MFLIILTKNDKLVDTNVITFVIDSSLTVL